jgi:(p)ppGpp synthase/HD superfamily hydrolase
MRSRLDAAIRLATTAHEGQYRKETPVPYITHPVAVALMLAQYGFAENVLTAAVTHDVLEDTGVGEDELRHTIGEEAFAIVQAVTNDNSLGWEEKKSAYIDSVRTGPEGALAVALADKVHNLESLIAAYTEQGEEVWKHFNAGMEKKLWFEESMLAMARQAWQHPLVDRYATLLKTLKSLTSRS